MTEPVPNPDAEPIPGPPEQPKPVSLEDSLSGLDDATRDFVLNEVRSARGEAKNLRERLKEAEPIVTQWRQLEEESKTELEKAQERERAATERISQITNRAVQAEVRALAAGKFADPGDAAAFLDASTYVSGDGDIDAAKIAADLDDLLAKKPHLAAQRGPRPNPAQGGSSNPVQLTGSDFMNQALRAAAGRASA